MEVTASVASKISAFVTGSQSLKSFVGKYKDAKQRGTVLEIVADAISRCSEAFKTGKMLQQADCIQEMLFLHMQGHDTSDLEFRVADLMSSEDYSIKAMAYTAASLLWNPDSQAILMAINCIRRDLTDADPLRKVLALTLIPIVVTNDVATNIASEVVACFNHSRQEVNQRAISCFYQICLKFPDALRSGFAQLNVKGKLEDQFEVGMQQTVLALVSELCLHNPGNFKNLVPTFYKLLTNAASPWILVRVLGIFRMIMGSLDAATAEKLGGKLVTPVSEVLNTAPSSSVVFEVIRLICDGPLKSRNLIQVAAERAQEFIENSDPNLRYLGLNAMTKLMKIDSKTIARHRSIITGCLESDDPTCVAIAVDLLQAIATNKNMAEFVLKLMGQIEQRPAGYIRDRLVTSVIEMCAYKDYERVSDFDWYINVLLEIHGFHVGSKEVAEQILAIALRVESLRPTCVTEMLDIMKDPSCAGAQMIETAAFVLGEYATDASAAFELLLSPKIDSVAPSGQAACIHNAFKLYTKETSEAQLKGYGEALLARLPHFAKSPFPEVQERASVIGALVGILQAAPDVDAMSGLFSVPLKAIAPTAQGKVPIPKGLDLTTPIVSLSSTEPTFDLFLGGSDDEADSGGQNSSIFILGGSSSKRTTAKSTGGRNSESQPKRRCLVPQTESRAVRLAPLEGGEVEAASRAKPHSALSEIDITTPLRASEKLPEVKPYSQDEIGTRRNRLKRSGRSGSDGLCNIDFGSYIKQVGNAQGIDVTLTGIRPRPNGLEMGIDVTNTSQMPISAVEFVLNDSAPQCMRTEIAAGEVHKHRIIFRSDPLTTQKVIKLTLLPTGGMSEMLRAKIQILPSFFLQPGKAADLETAIQNCDQRNRIALGTEIKGQDMIHMLTRVLKSPIIKTELDSRKIMASYSETSNGHIAIGIISRSEDGFGIDVCTNDEFLIASIIGELKAALAAESL